MSAHYGLHASGDLFFLHEQDSSACLNVNGLPSPFEVRSETPWLRCPHNLLPLGPGAAAPAPCELLLKLAPVPDGGAYWAPPAARPWLDLASRLCRATQRISFVPWATPIRRLAQHLHLTNLAPLVVADYETKDFQDLCRFLALPRTRTIVLCGAMKIPGSTSVDFTDTVPALDWEAIGAGLLRAHVDQKVKEARS